MALKIRSPPPTKIIHLLAVAKETGILTNSKPIFKRYTPNKAYIKNQSPL